MFKFKGSQLNDKYIVVIVLLDYYLSIIIACKIVFFDYFDFLARISKLQALLDHIMLRVHTYLCLSSPSSVICQSGRLMTRSRRHFLISGTLNLLSSRFLPASLSLPRLEIVKFAKLRMCNPHNPLPCSEKHARALP